MDGHEFFKPRPGVFKSKFRCMSTSRPSSNPCNSFFLYKFPDFFFVQAFKIVVDLKIQYVLAIYLMRWLIHFYDFGFKWTATRAIGIHPIKTWLSQLVNFKNAEWNSRSIFKHSLTGLSSEFSFSETDFYTKNKEPSLSYDLLITGGRKVWCIPFPRVLVLCEIVT